MDLTDADGNTWAPFENQFQQRKLMCIAGPRKGEEKDDASVERPAAPRRPRAWRVTDDESEYGF